MDPAGKGSRRHAEGEEGARPGEVSLGGPFPPAFLMGGSMEEQKELGPRGMGPSSNSVDGVTIVASSINLALHSVRPSLPFFRRVMKIK